MVLVEIDKTGGEVDKGTKKALSLANKAEKAGRVAKEHQEEMTVGIVIVSGLALGYILLKNK